jgi:hypothetical protein
MTTQVIIRRLYAVVSLGLILSHVIFHRQSLYAFYTERRKKKKGEESAVIGGCRWIQIRRKPRRYKFALQYRLQNSHLRVSVLTG